MYLAPFTKFSSIYALNDRMYPLLMDAVGQKNLCAMYNYGLYLLVNDAGSELNVSKSFVLFCQVATQLGETFSAVMGRHDPRS